MSVTDIQLWYNMLMANWHQKHQDQMTRGDRIADGVAAFVGSWKFVGIQSAIMTFWVVFNGYVASKYLSGHGFDPFPFIFLNLFMSAEAAYSTPFIMMSQNRAAARDKIHAEHQYENQEQEIKENTKITKDIHKLSTDIHGFLAMGIVSGDVKTKRRSTTKPVSVKVKEI